MRRIKDYPKNRVYGDLPVMTYPGTTPGEILRYSLKHGVPVDMQVSEGGYDDSFDDGVDPLADIRTDWDNLNERNIMMSQMPAAPAATTSEPAAPATSQEPAPATPAPAGAGGEA